MTKQEEKYLIGLVQIYGMTQALLTDLMRHYQSYEEAWHKYRSWGKALTISPRKLEAVIHARREQNLDAVWRYYQTVGAKILTVNDEAYPKAFSDIYEKPYYIFFFGELPKEDDFCLTMVGSRKFSDYGRDLAKRTAKELVEIAGATIVSGMAEGIDTIAHWAALNAGGKTIAVLGNGIDRIYPVFNGKLYEEIKEKGCIISDYPLGYESLAENFPKRNRLMSALGRGVIVIEAHRKSGVFHTVEHGLDQGKDIFAFPGSVFSGGSFASHYFIREGTAKPVFSTEDIIEEYFDLELLRRNQAEEALDFSNFSEDECKILEPLQRGDLSVEAIVRVSGKTPAEVNAMLTMLEVDGVITKKPGQVIGLSNIRYE